MYIFCISEGCILRSLERTTLRLTIGFDTPSIAEGLFLSCAFSCVLELKVGRSFGSLI